MRGMIGCAAMIAAVAFVLGLIGSVFASEANLAERLLIALMPAVMAFIAALMLSSRDYARHTRTVRRVRDRLMARDDTTDDEFLRSFPNTDFALMQQTRQSIARFFDVPVEKIYATDSLRGDLAFAALEPSFHSFVVYHVLNARNIEPQPFSFHAGKLDDIGDLVAEIHRVLDGLATSNRSDRDIQSDA